jgi:Transposase DDE domain group 1
VGLITNPRLREMAEDLLAKVEERHDRKGEKVRFFSEGPCGTASWEHPRRVLYKVEAMDKGTNTRFIVTTRTDEPKELHEFNARSEQSEN